MASPQKDDFLLNAISKNSYLLSAQRLKKCIILYLCFIRIQTLISLFMDRTVHSRIGYVISNLLRCLVKANKISCLREISDVSLDDRSFRLLALCLSSLSISSEGRKQMAESASCRIDCVSSIISERYSKTLRDNFCKIFCAD